MNRQYSNRGITLLEVIVLVVVVLILAVILLPIIHNGNSECILRSSCPDNLKCYAIALQLYWTDYNDQLPSSYLTNHSKRWNRHDSLRFCTIAGNRPPLVNTREQTMAQTLYGHMKNKDIMWCYSDAADRNNPDSQVSYWYKLAMDKAWYGEQCSKPHKRAADFAFPTDQIVFYEHQGWHFGTSDGLKNSRQINAAFMDSHVEPILIKNATSGDPLNCGANSDGEPMYYNYDNVKNTQDAGPAKHVDPSRYSDRL